MRRHQKTPPYKSAPQKIACVFTNESARAKSKILMLKYDTLLERKQTRAHEHDALDTVVNRLSISQTTA